MNNPDKVKDKDKDKVKDKDTVDRLMVLARRLFRAGSGDMYDHTHKALEDACYEALANGRDRYPDLWLYEEPDRYTGPTTNFDSGKYVGGDETRIKAIAELDGLDAFPVWRKP